MSKRKAPDGSVNQDFCDFLIELSDYEKNISRNLFKSTAYRKAAKAISEHPTRIKSGAEAKKLPGVGKKISEKIDEFLATGKLRKLENIHENDDVKVINLLTRVTGIGPAKAKTLLDEGIKTLEDLEKHKEILTHHQKVGLKHFNDFEKKIPRAEIVEIEKVIKENLGAGYLATICGSFRREKPESGDIDCLVTHPSFNSENKISKNNHLATIVENLTNCGLITDTLSLGDTKFMGACRLTPISTARRLDIRFLPHDQYYCGVLYFTGSDMFNRRMRAHALEMGFTLNEYCLRPVGVTGVPGEAVEITSERDVFDCIDFAYKEPKERNS